MTELKEKDENPADLIRRLLRAFAKQVGAIENKIDTEGPQPGEDDKTLQGMSRTMDTLLTLHRKAENGERDDQPNKEELRRELAKRLIRLACVDGEVVRPHPGDGASG